MQTSKGRFIYRAALFRVSYYQDLFKERLKMEKIRQLSRIFPDIVKSCHNFYCDSPCFIGRELFGFSPVEDCMSFLFVNIDQPRNPALTHPLVPYFGL